MIIIPAIDIIDGKCVRLTKGDYDNKKEYSANPLDVALEFEDHGLTHLHLVDLEGAKASQPKNLKVLEKLASGTSLIIDFGGGIKSNEAIRDVFNAGASKITAGSVAVHNSELVHEWIVQYGGEKILLGADIKDGGIAIQGWTKRTDENWRDFIGRYIQKGIKTIISTPVEKDGMLQGPDTALYQEMKQEFPSLNIIASGGISSLDDLGQLQDTGVYGAIIGKAIYEKKIHLNDLQRFLE